MDLQIIKTDILEKDIDYVYRTYLLGNKVWYFEEYLAQTDYSQKYDDLKDFVSGKLKVHFNDVAIFGSAKTGFSFSPSKNFKAFHEKSDLDIVVVSREKFEQFWQAYSDIHFNNVKPINEYTYVTKAIFQKYIVFNGFDLSSEVYKEWSKLESEFKKDLQTEFDIEHDINYRIFESWNAVKNYYTRNIRFLKSKLGG
ncbi:hypothetical protein [Paenibacillus kandeliae]|uniref:hypothetical protein n=1 Tax=Paenibacillus kandeliae TaxID=3231269 RepID=UPI003459E172